MQLQEFKSEIGQIFDRYGIPMDDKSFIMDKIEGQIGAVAQEVVKITNAEREREAQQVTQLKEKARGLVNGTLDKARNSVKQAYQLGLQEGAAEAVKAQGPNWTQILLTGGVLLLASYAGFTLIRDFWFNGKKKDE